MMMNDGVDDEIEDSGNHFHSKMVLAFWYGDDDERRCWWWDWIFWKPFPYQNGFGLRLTETISTAKQFWHSSTVMMTVMMMNDSVDDEIEDSAFGSFCFVLFGFIWGCRKQLCWDLCTVHKDFLMHHNRSPFGDVMSISWINDLFTCFIALIEIGRYNAQIYIKVYTNIKIAPL